jgi:hypothetical protein
MPLTFFTTSSTFGSFVTGAADIVKKLSISGE